MTLEEQAKVVTDEYHYKKKLYRLQLEKERSVLNERPG